MLSVSLSKMKGQYRSRFTVSKVQHCIFMIAAGGNAAHRTSDREWRPVVHV
jgi:hypothetical protein